MKVKEISLQRTFNLGNYESVRVGAVAEVSEYDTPKSVLEALKKEVIELFEKEVM